MTKQTDTDPLVERVIAAFERFLVPYEDYFERFGDEDFMSHMRRVSFGDWREARAAIAALASEPQPRADDALRERAAAAEWLRGQAAIYSEQNPDLSELPEWTLAQKWANAIERGEHRAAEQVAS